MVRYIPIGNGKLLVSFNNDYNLTDIYFSREMAENHSGGRPFKYGISVDNNFVWMNKNFLISKDYFDHTMIGIAKYKISDVYFEDQNFVDIYEDIFVRKVKILNTTDTIKKIKLFFHQNFSIYGNNIGDTAFYYPYNNSIIHYKGRRYFMISTLDGNTSFDQYSVGIKDFNGLAGTWKDAEDGELAMNTIATGSVDSIIRHTISIDPKASFELYYYILAARDLKSLLETSKEITVENLERMLKRTENFWELWVSKFQVNLDNSLNEMFKKSLFIIRSHINDKGAVLASSDSEILRSNMDSYYYSWPRDAAYAAISMIMSDHGDPAKLFFDFCISTISDDGYFYHKYNPDGKIASSWLPYYMNGKRILPIQEDESALVIIAIYYYYSVYKDIEYISYLYEKLIKKIADFLYEFTYENGLPRESFDLWEERFGINTYTVATVYSALKYASAFAQIFNDIDLSKKYMDKADLMLKTFKSTFYSDLTGYYGRTMNNGKIDFTPDSSVLSLINLDVLPPDDPTIKSTVNNIVSRLWVPDTGGLARYEKDFYQRRDNRYDIPGNPWIITTLWLADYYIKIKNFDKARDLISWVVNHSEASGILSEQIDPITGQPLSVSPLTWSHAQFVITLINYKNAINQK
ncbi:MULTISPECIES: glycoside hydrolase family 15 protein [Acidiplasma]|uniref:Glucoamylase n=2 Tax=Acidiplasma TaxID=507753 RepID=A0A0Q0RYW6_9ARCH|nr:MULTISPECIES: glycoside hydrolase family 15 protein [Acidiplasma]KJE49471.1 glucoamylase [Acidiplasma sp. MBA-1]KPV46403.1 glucoamylase [Acidiplasma aeolicum]KQB35536.1 glucoamylase [Acidiplasma cupricumulans]KQB36715.1 glucoamylase [Acidiplasma aeolicum]WMT54548.1 MAG: glycoside hydrolase family 15 protein [Acidiplasma sp.]